MVLKVEEKIVAPNFETIPKELKDKKQWILWKAELRKDGTIGKIPKQINGTNASTTDPSTWSSFQDIEEVFKNGRYDGIGFVFSSADQYIGIDLDGHYSEGNFNTKIAHLLSGYSYTEVSPSGTGLHTIFKGLLPNDIRHKNTAEKMEIYSEGRFFTFTGRVVGNGTITTNENIILKLIEKYFLKKKKVYSTHTRSGQASFMDHIDDVELLHIMFNSKNGKTIKRLFNGDTNEYNGDHSSADQALCNHLAFFTSKNAKRMDNLFRQSGLYRDKWDRKTGASTYGQITIQEAIDKTSRTYRLTEKVKQDNNGVQIIKNEKEEWERPVSFDEYELPVFPSNIFPKWLSDYVEGVAESTQTPKDMACMGAISCLSIATAKKFEVSPYGSWVEPLNTYTATLMGPAQRKTAVFDFMIKPILEYEQDERERLRIEVRKRKTEIDALKRRLEAVKNKNAQKPEPKYVEEMKKIDEEIESLAELYLPSYVVDDVTPEKLVQLLKENNGKVGILSAEGGIFEIIKGRYSKELNMDIFLKGHSGDYTRVDRKNGSTMIIKEPALTIGIFAQPDIITDLPRAFKGRGLMARFLYSLPKDFRGYRKIRPEDISIEVRDQYMQNVKRLLDLPGDEIQRLTFTNEADVFLQSFQQEIEERLRDGNDLADIAEWGGKIVGQIIRISALLHVAENIINDNVIPEKIATTTVVQAIRTKEYFISHAKASFGCMSIDKDLENAKYILNKIEEKFKGETVISHQELWQLVKRRFGKASELDGTLEILETRGFVKSGKEGRKKIININPKIWFPTSPNATGSIKT
ncbi:phage NrS-1 polymerase family protein [Priestia megaterium]|uniref:phage NrS-1 polymerase family protein n=1 Tax=Priestia megaterium TaxID=1404 RepID=UPI002FFEF82C